MKQIRMLAQYYVDLMMKLGLVRFSMLLAFALVVLAIVVQMAVTMVLHGQVESIDVIRSIFFGLLITPWAVYFLSVVVEQLEESRQRLSRLVEKLEEMRERDLKLNVPGRLLTTGSAPVSPKERRRRILIPRSLF